MKAIVMRDWEEAFFPEAKPDPEPGVRPCSICAPAVWAARVMGHETGGDIVAIGAGVEGLSIMSRPANPPQRESPKFTMPTLFR